MKTESKQTLQNDLQFLEQETAAEDLFRLAQARNNALKGRGKKSHRLMWPATAVAAASVLLAVFLVGPFAPEKAPVPVASEKSLQDESDEFYENLEFYYWVAEAADLKTG